MQNDLSPTMAPCTPIPLISDGIVPFGNGRMAAAFQQVPDMDHIPGNEVSYAKILEKIILK
jgi:hypothetical protein